MTDIWDSFDDEDEEVVSEQACILQFGTERVPVDLSAPGAPRTLAEAFRLNAERLGTDARATVQFRAGNQALEANTPLQAGMNYTAATTSDKHGR